MRFRIGVDARPLSTSITGVGRMIAEIIRHFPNQETYEFHLFSHREIHPEHSGLLALDNVVFHQGKGPFSLKGAIYFNLYLPLTLSRHKLDLFWGSQQIIPPFLPSSLPVVLTYYDFVLYLFPGTMRKIAALQQKMFQKYSIKRADHITSISGQTRDDLLRMFHYPENQTSVIFPGIQPESIKKLLREKPGEKISNLPRRFFLSVSTIEPRKNYPFLHKAYTAYRKIAGSRKIPWVIAGKTGWESQEFIAKLKYDSVKYGDIFFVQSPTDSELHHLYQRCEVFLFASHYEGFGIPLLEALFHHKKSIVSDIPTFHEIGGKQVCYLSASSPELWAAEMLKRQSLKSKPTIHLSKFTWEYSAQKMEKIFFNILDR